MKIFYTAIFFALLFSLSNCLGQPSPPGGTNDDGGYGTNNPYPSYTPPVFSYPTSATLLWQVQLDGDTLASPMISPNGTIYVFQATGEGYSDSFFAVNPDGSIKWQTSEATTVGGSLSGVIGIDGTLYVPTHSSGQNLIGINPVDGSTNLIFQVPNFDGVEAGSPAIDTNGVIYMPYYSQVYAITNGFLKWTYPTGDNTGGNDFQYSSPVVGGDGTIYINSWVTSSSGVLFALNPDGSLKWMTNSLSGRSNIVQYADYFGSPAIAFDGTIYCGANNYFSAVNPDGTIKWQFVVTNENFTLAPTVGPQGTIYVEGCKQGIDTNTLYALNSDGSVKWTFPVPSDSGVLTWFKGSSCAIASDGQIYVSSSDGTLYSLAPDGTMNWSYQTQNGGLKPPVIGPDGTIYVSSYNSEESGNPPYLFAFYGSAPVACSAWPEFRKNSRRTAAVASVQVSSPLMMTNGFQLTITGTTNMPVCPCATSDFNYWTNVGQTVLTDGTTNFVDSGASNFQYRFYRAFPQ
jgi:outer membrane protein assembly factor BamB